MEATATSFNSLTNNYHGIQMETERERERDRDRDREREGRHDGREEGWGGKEKEKEKEKEEDPLVKNILRVVSALFVINIALSFINLAWT